MYKEKKVYYGKQSNSNSDFYNSYRSSYYQYNNEQDYLTLILKLLVIIFLLGLLFFGYLYISNKNSIKKDNNFKISQEMPKESSEVEDKINIVKREISNSSKLNLTQEEIANIVEIVMSKLKKKKNTQVVSDDEYTKELLSQEVDRLNSDKNLNINSINSKKIVQKSLSLKDINHYNKIVVNSPKEDKYTNDTLSNLSIELKNAIKENSLDKDSSDYAKEIKKEIKVRSNEMRIIIVKKGDSLSKIAKRAYGDYDSYVKIFEANPEIIKNPNQIYVGEKLRIPL